MTVDSYEQIRQRFAGISRGAEIQERVQQDAALKAAIAIEQEKRAEQQARHEALAREAALIAEAERAAVERLAALKPLYAEREAAARQAIEALAAVVRIETEIRDGLQLADRVASEVEALIEPTQRARWRSSLRERAGLAPRHIFTAPKQWVKTDAQRTGAAAVAALTASIILPGRIETPRGDVIDFEF